MKIESGRVVLEGTRLSLPSSECDFVTSHVLMEIILKDGHRPIGQLRLGALDRVNQRAAIQTIHIAQDCRGHHYAAEAIGAVVEWAFGHLDLHRLTAHVGANNVSAIRAFQRAGFEHEGRDRDHFCIDGAFQDGVRLGCLRGANPTEAAQKRCEAAVLRGIRHALVPFTEALVSEQYIGWLNDPLVNRFLEVRHAKQTLASGREFVRSIRQDPLRYFWAVTEGDTRGMVGTATLSLNLQRESAEVGLLIGERDRWGRGAADETIDLLAQFAFSQLGVQRVTGGTYATNTGMNFTFRRLGFLREGVLRKSHRLDDGSLVDEFLWGARAEEWKPRVPLAVEAANL